MRTIRGVIRNVRTMKEGAFPFPEVEAKIIEVDKNRDEARLLELGAKFVSQKELVAVWMEWHGKKFRVRKEGDDTKIESKTAIFSGGGIKACEEVGFGADSFEGTLRFFTTLGFVETSHNVKDRVTYLLGLDCGSTAEIVFDSYSDLDGMEIPALIEIEVAELPDSAVEECAGDVAKLTVAMREKIVTAAGLMGYAEDDLKDWSARELSAHYRALGLAA